MSATIVLLNLPSFLRGINESQQLQLKFMRGEMRRGARRIRKRFIKEQLRGRPGIRAPKLARGKSVFAFVRGDSHKDVSGFVGISRILKVHETGAVVKARQGQYLFLREEKGGPGVGRIIAKVPRVVIPARTHFRQLVRQAAPETLRKVAEAGLRASQVAMEKHLKRAIGL